MTSKIAVFLASALLSFSALAAVPSIPPPAVGSIAIQNANNVNLTGGTATAVNVTGSTVTPASGTSASSLATLLGRVISVDDAAGIAHNGSTDDVIATQSVINAVYAAGGGTVLVGAHEYALGVTPPAVLQPTAAQFNTSGFTLTVPSASSYFTPGNSYTLSGFTAPFTQLNGTWTASSSTGNFVVFLTSLTGTQSSTSTGLGSVYLNLTIPYGVKLVCPKGLTGGIPAGTAYTTQPYSLLLSSNITLTVLGGGSISGCNIINPSMTQVVSTASITQNLAQVAAFAGTGVNLSGSDTSLENLAIMGYSLGVNAYYAPRARMEHVNTDATQCVNVNQSHDISHFIDLHCFPFTTANANQFAIYPITGVANNGSGLWRVSTASTSNFSVGGTVFISGVVGAGSVNNPGTIAAVGSGYIDIASTGTPAAGASFTATLSSSSYCITAVSNMVGIGIGDGISGTGIPASSTVVDVLPRESTACINNKTTASGTAVAITTTPVAYSSGGNIYQDSANRTGYGFAWANGETNSCTDCYSYDHTVNFYTGSGAWTTLINTKADNYLPELATNSVGYWMDGSANGTTIQGGSTNSVWVPLVITSTNTNQAHLISGMVLNGAGKTLEMASGRAVIVGNSSGFGTPLNFVADAVGALVFGLNDLKTTWEFQTATGFGAVNAAGTFGTSTQSGTFTQTGQVNLGGGGTNCPNFSNCGVSTKGPQVMTDSNPTGLYGSYTIPGNLGFWTFTGTVSSQPYTVTLPVGVYGQRLPILFQTATSLNWTAASGATVGFAPSQVSANEIVTCQEVSTVWYCSDNGKPSTVTQTTLTNNVARTPSTINTTSVSLSIDTNTLAAAASQNCTLSVAGLTALEIYSVTNSGASAARFTGTPSFTVPLGKSYTVNCSTTTNLTLTAQETVN